MTNEELMALIEKAAITTSVATTVSVEDANAFIDMAVEQNAILQKFRVERNIVTGRKLDTLELGEPVTHADSENTEPEGDEVIVPTFGQKQLTPAAARLDYDITFDTLRENIEGQDINTTLNRAFSKRHGKDLVMMAFRGDTSLADTSRTNKALRIFDGVNKQAANSGNVHTLDIGSGYSGSDNTDLLGEVFPYMRDLMPTDYMDPEMLGMFVSWPRYFKYLDQLGARNTTLGDKAVTGEITLKWQGIPVEPVYGQVDGYLHLTPYKNIAVGWGREMQKGQDVYNRAGRIEVTIRTSLDTKIVLDDALVVAYAAT